MALLSTLKGRGQGEGEMTWRQIHLAANVLHDTHICDVIIILLYYVIFFIMISFDKYCLFLWLFDVCIYG